MSSYSNLTFLSNETLKNAGSEARFETNNLVHCFSKKMKFSEFLKGFEDSEKQEMKLNNYAVDEFLLGSSKTGDSKRYVFEHLEMNVHFLVKQHNRGKIESHLWFFKGFCQTIDPEF